MQRIVLRALVVLGMLVCASGQVSAAMIKTFNANGTFIGGGTLSGTVGIDVESGTVLEAELFATVTKTYHFTTNVGGIPNYGNTGMFVIVANYLEGYPISLMGVNEDSLVNYKGGPISSASNVAFQDGFLSVLSSGNFSIGSVEYVGPNTFVDFAASGIFGDGGALGGSVTVNITSGEVLEADLTAVITKTYELSSNVGGIPNYGNTGLFVIVANESLGAYPVGLFGLNETSLVGFDGGALVGGSNLAFNDGAQIVLQSGSLTAVPEASTLALTGLGVCIGFVGYRRRQR